MKKCVANCDTISAGVRLLGVTLFLTAGSALAVESCITLDDLDNAAWRPDRVWIYKEGEGYRLPMAVFYPPGHKPSDSRPAVVCIHGGAWSGGSDVPGAVVYPQARYFASRGAVAFSIEYRNLPRPTLKEKIAPQEYRHVPNPEFETGPDVFDLLADCKSALRHIRKNAHTHGIDPEHIAVIGDSAGGHLTAALGTIQGFDDPRDDLSINGMANAIIPCNAITDMTDERWLAFVPTTPRTWEKGEERSRIERAKLISPMYAISEESVPCLIMHGKLDPVVLPWHSTRFYEKMRAVGRRCDILLLDDATHAFLLLGYTATYRQIITAMTRADQFLVSLGYLSGEATLKAAHQQWDKKLVARFAAGNLRGNKIYDSVDPERYAVFPSPRNESEKKQKPQELVEDPDRGRVVKVYGNRAGIVVDNLVGMGHETTISLWIKPDSDQGTLITRRAGFGTSKLGYALTLDKTKGIVLTVGGTAVYAEDAVGRLKPKEWHHIVCSMGSGRAVIFVNGKKLVEKNGLDFSLAGNKITFGAIIGLIDDLRIYNYAMQDDGVKTVKDVQ